MLLKLMKQKGFISEMDCYSHVERGYQKRRTFWDGTNQIVFSEKWSWMPNGLPNDS